MATAWSKGPKCDYGLTVVNLNDCIKGRVYSFTEEDRQSLNELVRMAESRCTTRSDLFINDASFYPKLPPDYSQLVPKYTEAAQDAGAAVHDGTDKERKIKLKDPMHFHADSTAEIVDMYIAAVL